ncbi:MAG: hypothetical protein H6559_28215 [Lewinellaceae bacterium]|nr:hypothetical protein [Lewinellaceae bacterium]
MKTTLSFLAAILALSPLAAQPDTIRQNRHLPNAPAATETHVQLTIQVLDLRNRGVAGLELWAVNKKQAKVWYGQTDGRGEAVFLLPRGQAFTLNTADEPGIKDFRTVDAKFVRSRLGVGYSPKEYTEVVRNDTVFQQVAESQMPTRSRVLLWLTVEGFDGQPHEGEQLYFRLRKSGRVFAAETDATGRAILMLPKGDSITISTLFEPEVAHFFLPNDDRAGKVRLRYTTIGTKAILARRAERARQAAIRDSLYRLERRLDSLAAERALAGEEDFLHMLSFGADPERVKEVIELRAAKERLHIEADERYFEKTGQEIEAALYRKRAEWSNKVIVTDITGSMYPYMDQILLWHALAFVPGEQNRYIFFNDGDGKPEAEKKLGATGGIYVNEEMNMDRLLETMNRAMTAGSGGVTPENDLEALLEGVRLMGEIDELVLIADNYSDVRDIELLTQLHAPVRIVLAGVDHGINEDYLTIAYATGGSIHTLEEDVETLSHLADGEVVKIGDYRYRVNRGQFIQLSD